LNGKDLRDRSLVERRNLLAKLLEKAPENIKFSEELSGRQRPASLERRNDLRWSV
jgi:ATP-dependent DNA ligase